jgi:hypothetical protein
MHSQPHLLQPLRIATQQPRDARAYVVGHLQQQHQQQKKTKAAQQQWKLSAAVE